jgi:glycine/D-amino acid oxidase-like deaminating enzyme
MSADASPEEALPPVEDSCYWLASRPARAPQDRLAGVVDADVAIVGGGFTGLWTALALTDAEPGLRVAIVEQRLCGYGASGRNAGIVGETLDHSHDLAIAHFGLEEAKRLARLGRENLDGLETFLRERRLEGGFERTGQLLVALADEALGDLERSRATAELLGAGGQRLLGREEATAEIASPRVRGALLLERNAVVEPLRLVEGLLAEALRRGARVFEHSPVASLGVGGGRAVVRGAQGELRADRVVLATNAYSHHLWPGLRRWFLPLYDYVLVSEPLSAAQVAAAGWPNRRALVDTRSFFNYARWTADRRILWGTSEALYHRGNRVDESCDHSPRHYAALRESFAAFLPQLGELRFPYAWGGPIASTTRFTPFFGSAAGGRIHYGLGYTGHGIASTRLAGRILADLALDRRSELLDLKMVRSKPVPFPPEPLRGWAIQAVTRQLRRMDAGEGAGWLLRLLDRLGIGLSS